MEELDKSPKAPGDREQLSKYAEDLSRLYILEKERRKELEALALEMSTMEERERSVIAEELHDTIGQELAIARIKIGQLIRSKNETQRSELMEIDMLIKKTIASIRNMLFKINPNVLLELGFAEAMQWFIERIQNDHGLKIVFSNDRAVDLLDLNMKKVLFAGVRELITNTVKHAQSESAKVTVKRYGDDISVKIQDDGIGFDPSGILLRPAEKQSYGIFNLRQRLLFHGGRLDFYSSPGSGTSVVITLPMKREQKETGYKDKTSSRGEL